MTDPFATAANVKPHTSQPKDLSATFQDILDQLDNPTCDKTGKQWSACCPCHDDKQASLSLCLDGDRILLHCHANCDTEDVAAAFGLRMSDLSANGSKPKATRPKAKRRIVKTYDYTDEGGDLLFQVVRFDPKDFRQRQPDGKGGWTWSIAGVRRVLYHLPELAKLQPGDTVYLCEGEKSADAIRALGVTATCNPMGAGKWQPEYTELLRGRRVVILPDNDKAGQEHAADVTRALYGVASSRHVLTLPNLADKGDPFDWVQAGGDLAELQKLSKDLPDAPVQQTSKPGRPRTRRLQIQDYIGLFHRWGYKIELNECNDDLEVNGKPLDDVQEDVILGKVTDHGIKRNLRTSTTHARRALTIQGLANAYHPVKRYLEGLRWDGQDHIATLAGYFTDSDGKSGKDGLFYHWFRHWIVGSVAKVYDRYQNPMLVLDGAQELGKSHFARWLCPLDRAFNAAAIYPEYKDCRLRLIDTWVWEVEELGSTTRKADLDSLKAFLSTQEVRERKPYGHRDIVKPAMASFIGTINNDSGFLVDRTGNRRFLVCTLQHIDWSYADHLVIGQLWAQAKALFDAGDTWKLDQADKMLRDSGNEDYMVDDPIEAILTDVIEFTGDPGDVMTLPQLLSLLHDRCTVSQRSQAMGIASILTSWGAEKDRIRIKGVRTRVYKGVKVAF